MICNINLSMVLSVGLELLMITFVTIKLMSNSTELYCTKMYYFTCYIPIIKRYWLFDGHPINV